MVSLGSELKTEREKRNISLAQIAADTRISLHYLRSLEEGHYSALPGGMYNRAFLRAYCESIHLDPHDIIKRYETEISPPLEKPPNPKVRISQPKSSNFKPVIIWSVMLLISATGLFFSREWIFEIFSPYFSHKQSSEIHIGSFPPPKKPEATESLSQNAVEVLKSSSAADFAAETDSAATSPLPSSSKPSGLTQAPLDGNQPLLSSDIPTEPLKIELAATDECWISIDQDGQNVFRRILEPGEIQSLSAAENFFLVVGNAGGLHLKINGKPAKQLGAPGEVIRLLINEDNFPDLIDPIAG